MNEDNSDNLVLPVNIEYVGSTELYSGKYDGSTAATITFTTPPPQPQRITIAIKENQLHELLILLAQVSNDISDSYRPIDENGNLKDKD